jgi:cysteine desulfurase
MATAHTYLDYNATAPVRPEAMDAALEAMMLGANPSSVHTPGRRARSLISRAREQVAALVGAAPGEVVFTSGGTESNALALLGAAEAGLVNRLIVSATEHDSVVETAKLACRRGVALDIVRTRPDGQIDLADLERALSGLPSFVWEGDRARDAGGATGSSLIPHPNRREGRALVSVMAANNETGVIQPLLDVVALARKYGALMHTDAVQIAGRLAFDASAFDLVTLSAHKLGGIAGAGALIVRDVLALAPLHGGGRQEIGRRPGTEPLGAIAAFGAAAEAAAQEMSLSHAHERWRNAMEGRLRLAVPDLKLFGDDSPRLPQTSCVGLPGTKAETQVIALDLAGFALSAGAACSSGKVRASRVLQAMGAVDREATCAIRISFGWATREEELAAFTDVWTRQLKLSAGLMLRDEGMGIQMKDSLILSLSKDEDHRLGVA